MKKSSDEGKPPVLARALLRRLISQPIYQEIAGDFLELYRDRRDEKGRLYASLCYWIDALDAIRNVRLRRKTNSVKMSPIIKHSFKLSLRNLYKNKGYAYLNVFGLLAGALSALIILQYVYFEKSFDTFHQNGKQIYRLRLDTVSGDLVQPSAMSFAPLGEFLERDFPEVVTSGRMIYAYGGTVYEAVSSGSPVRHKESRVYRANQGFWDIFSFDLLMGNQHELLTRPGTAIISKSRAIKYFGSIDAVGEVLKRNGRETYEITGVFEDLPANSHLQFDVLLAQPEIEMNEYVWRSYNAFNYLQLRRDADVDRFAEAIESYIDQYSQPDDYSMKLGMQPMLSLHFDHSALNDTTVKGDKTSVNTLYIMALAIVLIAWVNFVNLHSVAALNRGKETAMRLVFGARSRQTIIQCIIESFLIHFITWVLAIGLLYLSIPWISNWLGVKLSANMLDSFLLWHILLFLIGGSLLTGFYPSLVLLSFKVKHVLKGKSSVSSKGLVLRKALVVIQYAASMALVIITLFVFAQISFMRNASLGINTKKTLAVYGPSVRDSTVYTRLESMKAQWLSIPGVEQVAYGQDVPGSAIRVSFGGVRRPEVTEGSQIRVTNIQPDYAQLYELQFVEGRNVSKDIPSDVGKIYLNEAAVKFMGFSSPEDAVGQRLIFPRNEQPEIVGVVKDFHISSVKGQIDPAIFHYRPRTWSFALDMASVRLNTSTPLSSIEQMETVFRAQFPEDVFEYFFVDEHFSNQYQSDALFGRLFGLFSGLAVLIATLGLFGLTSFSLLRRLKEISIRKVLGAHTHQVVPLIAGNFLILLTLAVLIAVPFSYWFLDSWLTDFALRQRLHWYHFVGPPLVLLVITITLVVNQTARVARKNPSRYLRME